MNEVYNICIYMAVYSERQIGGAVILRSNNLD